MQTNPERNYSNKNPFVIPKIRSLEDDSVRIECLLYIKEFYILPSVVLSGREESLSKNPFFNKLSIS